MQRKIDRPASASLLEESATLQDTASLSPSPKQQQQQDLRDPPPLQSSCHSAHSPLAPVIRSLATGRYSQHNGSVQQFDASPLSSPKNHKNSQLMEDCTFPEIIVQDSSPEKEEQPQEQQRRPSSLIMAKIKENSKPFQRHLSSFLRVADLAMDHNEIMYEASSSSSLGNKNKCVLSIDPDNEDGEVTHPNFHHASMNPPPGVAADPRELWISLDNGIDGAHAPIAPTAINALALTGLASAWNQAMWSPDAKTAKLLQQQPDWKKCVWQDSGNAVVLEKNQDAVFVWTGCFNHGLYGSDLPAVRAAGVLDMSPTDLLDLLVDSDRVQEYNKLSLGRTDVLVLQHDYSSDSGPFGGITKVMRSKSRPPLLRKTLQFTSILHARKLVDGSGYKIVTRAVTTANNNDDNDDELQNNQNKQQQKEEAVLTSEILMGVTILKRIEGNDNRCLVITVNHIRAPMLPMMIAKRIGLAAATNFIHDLRSCC